ATVLSGPCRPGRRRRRQRKPAQPKPPRAPRTRRTARGTPQRLLVTAGGLAGTTIGLSNQQITIGRANDATLVLNDDYASSRHARVFPQDGPWIAEELGSTTGTDLDRPQRAQ